MRIAFATTLNPAASTNIGRVWPLAAELAHNHDVHVLALSARGRSPGLKSTDAFSVHRVGAEPFERTGSQKKHMNSLRLAISLMAIAMNTAVRLSIARPQRVIIVKPHPHNVLGVLIWRYTVGWRAKIILDADDFELTANTISSLAARTAIHWAERVGARLASHITVASPFLADHFTFLTAGKRSVTLIPTGIRTRDYSPTTLATSGTSLAYFGSLSQSSGHRVDMLPEILTIIKKELDDAHLLLAGYGHDADILKQAFLEAGLEESVTFHGRFTTDEISSLMDDVAVLIDPVDASIEVRAKSSYRAMLATVFGKPVITSNVGIRPRLVPTQFHDRFFAEPGNASSYGRQCVKALRARLSQPEIQLLQSHAQRFEWSKLAQQFATCL